LEGPVFTRFFYVLDFLCIEYCKPASPEVKADVYEILYSYTDGSHAKSDDSFKTTYRIKNLAYNHVYQVRVRAITVINKEIFIGPWSNIAFITPYPNKVSGKAIGTVSNPGMKINWNIIYGCNGYNVFLTTSI
jgi:hypothetical protein